jgi:fibrinogen beta/gamma subunit family protein
MRAQPFHALVPLLILACGSVKHQAADGRAGADRPPSDGGAPADAAVDMAGAEAPVDSVLGAETTVPDAPADRNGDAPPTDAPPDKTPPDGAPPDRTPPGPEAPVVNDGSSPDRAGESCLAILVRAGLKTDGRYWIRPDPLGPPIQVFCDMTQDEGGWTLVFKISDGLAGDASEIWAAATPLNEGRAELLNRDRAALNYMNRIVTDAWNSTFVVRRVRMHYYIAGQTRAFVIFAGNQTTRASWLDKANLLTSSWTDLSPTATTNFFSLVGDPGFVRRFFANINYGGCDIDRGWFVVSSGTFCPWDDPTTNMRILYSGEKTAALWQSASAAHADVLAVYVK